RDARLVLHPATLAVGVGCERGVAAAEVADLVRRCLAEATLAVGAVAGIYSIALKAAEPAIHAVADKLGVPARFFEAETLLAETPRLTEGSEIVFPETGCLGGAGRGARPAPRPGATLGAPQPRPRGA